MLYPLASRSAATSTSSSSVRSRQGGDVRKGDLWEEVWLGIWLPEDWPLEINKQCIP